MYIQFKDSFTWVGRIDIDDRQDTVSLTINGEYRLNLKYKVNPQTNRLYTKQQLITLIKRNYNNNTVIDLNYILEDIEKPDIELYMENLQSTFVTEESLKEKIIHGEEFNSSINKIPIDSSNKNERSINDLLGIKEEEKDFEDIKRRVEDMEDPVLKKVDVKLPSTSELAIDSDTFGLNSSYFDEEELSKVIEEDRAKSNEESNSAISEGFSKYSPPKTDSENKNKLEKDNYNVGKTSTEHKPINDFLTRKMLEISSRRGRKGDKLTGLGILKLLSRL